MPGPVQTSLVVIRCVYLQGAIYRHIYIYVCTIVYRQISIQYTIQILYSLRITTCNQHEVHNLTRLFCYNNTKWLIDLGREKKSVLKT